MYISLNENVRFFVQGGFADVTTGELIILAEKACLIDDIDREEIKNDIEFRQRILSSSRRRSSFIYATKSRWSPIRFS
jgi:F0F1-type ATP synthase epsilon subunit